MVRVPTYEQNVSLRPALQQGVTVRATPEAFGSDIGKGLQNLGQGMAQASTALAQVQELENTARAKEADNQFAGWLRERMYGEGGFMTLSGRNAVDGRAAFEQDVENKRREFGSNLTGGAAQSYSNASTARTQQILQTSIVHTANERKTWFTDSSNARLNTFSEDAIAAYNDPAKINFNIAAGQAEIRQQAALMGWDADQTRNREAEYISEVRLNTALRMAAADPVAAQKYYTEHKSQLTGPHQFKFEQDIKTPLATARVMQHTANFFSAGAAAGAGSSAAASDYFANIRAAESGDNDAAKNPNSTATGRYQFTAGTWAGLMRNHPGLGLTADGRTDPAQQERAIKVFTEENSRTLAQSGIAVTNGTLYAAHFLGSFGAVRALRAPPETRMADVVAPGVIEANPFLRGMTVGQFATWAEGKGGGTGRAAPQGGGAAMGYNTIEPFLQTISDPTERELTRKAIYAQLETQQKAQKAEKEAFTAQAFNLVETQNISPFNLPSNITTAIGMEGMSSLMTYWEKKQSGQAITTDAVILHDLQMAYARNPAEFAQRDLFQYKNSLSETDWKQVSTWKQTALTDERKAREEGLTLTTAFSQATAQLDAVGITTTGKTGDDREAAARQIAQFNAALTAEMEAFKQQNQKAPTQADIMAMTNRLLLPVVIKQPYDGGSGLFGMYLPGYGPQTNEMRLFEAGGVGAIGPGLASELNVKYADIPVPDRVQITAHLKAELGRQPSEDQVIEVYERYLLERNAVPMR